MNALPPRPAADLCTTSGARWTKTVTDAPVRIRRAFDVICGFELDGGVSDGAVLGEDLACRVQHAMPRGVVVGNDVHGRDLHPACQGPDVEVVDLPYPGHSG